MAENVRFVELRVSDLDWGVVNDLKLLLSQLSNNYEELTMTRVLEILESGTRIFAAIHRQCVVSTVLLCRMHILVGQKYWIEDVVTREDYRKQGISSRLMDMAEEAAAKEGGKNVNLTSNPARVEAREGYFKRGYVLRDTGVFRKTL